MPERIQRSRAKGARLPEGAVVVTRPSRWGNPFKVTPTRDAAACVAKYRARVEADAAFMAQIRDELAGKDLACWCNPTSPCHADVLLELANRGCGSTPGPGHDSGP